MLIIMIDRDIQYFLKPFFNLKTAGSADIFQIDAAKPGCQIGDSLDDLFGILSIQADGHCVDTAEFLEQYSLAFHDRHSGIGADIAQSKNGAAVRYHSYGVGFPGIGIGRFPIGSDNLTGFCHAGCVGKGQVLAAFDGCLGDGLKLALPLFVQFQCFFIGCHGNTSFLS